MAQDNVLKLLPGSKSLIVNEKEGTNHISGNVHFIYQNHDMFCDSAVFHKERNFLWAFGNVRIKKGETLTIFCDSLAYNGKIKIANLFHNIRILESDYIMTTEHLVYNAKTEQASYFNYGVVKSISSNETLTSKYGHYHPKSKNFFFSRQVNYKGAELSMTTDTLQFLYATSNAVFQGPTNIVSNATTMYCEKGWFNTKEKSGSLIQDAKVINENSIMKGDTLHYASKNERYIGIGNVSVEDTVENVAVYGEYAQSSKLEGKTFITGNAYIAKPMNDDTVYVHADTIFNVKIDSIDYIRAYNNGRIYSKKIQGICDSITFNTQTENITFHKSPILWSNEAELKGELIDVKIEESKLQEVIISPFGSIVMEVDSGRYYNQIYGKDLVAKFDSNSIYRATISGNAITLFYPEEEEVSGDTLYIKRNGMNRIYSTNLRLDIDSNEISGITYTTKPDAVFYPIDKIKASEQFIPNFSANFFLRPKNRDELLLK